MKRGYIVLIIGAAPLVSGIIISILWAVPLTGTILSENTIVSGASIKPAGSVNAYIQVIDVSRPVSLGIHVERNNNSTGGQVPNNILRETVRNPNGIIVTSNEFSRQFFTTFEPDITGRYTISVSNLGNSPVGIGVISGNLPFIGANNKVNFGPLGGIIVGGILIVVGIIILIAGIIVVIVDTRKMTPKTQTTLPSSLSSEATKTETIVLARWIDRFIAWLVDFIIVSIGIAILFAVISLPFWIAFPQWFESTNMNKAFRNEGPLNYIISSLVFMVYWTYFESTSGKSIGKKLLHLKTTDLVGKNIDPRTAVIQSFGKAFLLPIDVILGWILTNDKRQRIFNRASNTIVIKLKEDGSISGNSKYVKA